MNEKLVRQVSREIAEALSAGQPDRYPSRRAALELLRSPHWTQDRKSVV